MMIDFTLSFCVLYCKGAMEHCIIQREEKKTKSTIWRAGTQLTLLWEHVWNKEAHLGTSKEN